jgi:hypothetical protein
MQGSTVVAMIVVICCLLLCNVALGQTNTDIIVVAGDGSGDFNCDGSNDHVEINAALQHVAKTPELTTVYLKGPFTYEIRDTILLPSNTILTGDKTAVIKLGSNINWLTYKPMIANQNYLSGHYLTGDHDIEVYGFEINGNREGNPKINSGQNYHNMFVFKFCRNISVHDMYLHNNHNDAVVFQSSDNLKYYNNTINRIGHDGLYAYKSTNVEVYNNRITNRINCSFRIYNTNHASVHDNVIDSYNEGGAGIQIEKESEAYPMDDVEIYNNVIYRTSRAGIWVYGMGNPYPKQQVANLHIHHNKIYDAGIHGSSDWVGGIVINGFWDALIENNVIDGCYGAAIAHKWVSTWKPYGSGYTTIVRNNIITNTRPHVSAGRGVGIMNAMSDTHTFILEYNCLYNNPGGNYINASSTTDIYADPLFVDRAKQDYHLKSTGGRWDGSAWVIDDVHSPCIDAGHPSSDYSLEPSPNGGRVNIGLYGNTAEASKASPVN